MKMDSKDGVLFNMTNILESIKSIASNFTQHEGVDPIHIGEVMNLWLYLAMLEEMNRYIEIALNTTKDKELIEALQSSHADCSKHISEISVLFKNEGIALPPASQEKPYSNPDDIPQGVKLTDEEIANGLSLKLILALTLCTTGFSQAIRSDIGSMWQKFIIKRMEFGMILNPLIRRRNWMKIPPYYNPPGTPSAKH